MSTRKTFMELLMAGETSPDAIDDFIDEWHDAADMRVPLGAFLGMTVREYAIWAKTANLQGIVAARRAIDAKGAP